MQRIICCISSEIKYYCKKKKGFQVFSCFSCPADGKGWGFVLCKDGLKSRSGQRAAE